MHLDPEGGQGKGAERQQSAGSGIGSRTLPVLDEPGHKSLLKGVLVVVEEYAKEALIRCQEADCVQFPGVECLSYALSADLMAGHFNDSGLRDAAGL